MNRAIAAYRFFYQNVSMAALFQRFAKVENKTFHILEAAPNHVLFTANSDTPYAAIPLDLKDGPITVELKNLPANVTAPKATIAQDQASAEIEISAADTAALGDKADVSLSGVGNAPVHLHPGGAGLAIRDQPQLEPADREADVEGLVEVRVPAEHLTIPLLASGEVWGGIDGGPQSLNHGTPSAAANNTVKLPGPRR